jgi:hypothetical protein
MLLFTTDKPHNSALYVSEYCGTPTEWLRTTIEASSSTFVNYILVQIFGARLFACDDARKMYGIE